MCKNLFPFKLLIDVDNWQFGGKTKLNFIYSALPVKKKNFPTLLGTGHLKMIQLQY